MAQERKVPMQRTDSSLIEAEFDSIKEKFEMEMKKMEEEMTRFRAQLIASERRPHNFNDSPAPAAPSIGASGLSLSGQNHSSSLEASTASSFSSSLFPNHNHHHQLLSSSSSSSSTHKTKSSTSSLQRQQQQYTSIGTTNSSISQEERQQQQQQKQRQDNSNSTASDWLHGLSSPLIHESSDGSGARWLKLRFDVSAYEPEQILVKTLDNRRLMIHAKREESSANKSMYREYNREFLLPHGIEPELIKSSLSADGVLTVEAPLPQATS